MAGSCVGADAGVRGRRLLAEPVALVFAARETDEALEGLPELEVGGLREGDARALLERWSGSCSMSGSAIASLRRHAAIRWRCWSCREGLTATQLAGGFGLLGAQALSGRIEESFQRRLEALADQTRMLLLIAAADPVGDPLLLWRAADRLGIGALAAECGGGGIAGDRRTGDVPPSAGALGGLPDGIAESTGERRISRWRRSPTGESTPTAARGIWRRRQAAPTRTLRRSSSARRTERRREVALPRQPPSCGVRSR